MEFDNVAKKRISVRKFTSKKPPAEKIVECIEIANLSPTPGNVHILKYLIVDDEKRISFIADACQQDFIKKAPYIVVFCSDKKLVKKLYEQTDKYIKHHVGAAIENFLLKAVDLGLGASLVEVFSEKSLRFNLGIPDDIDIEVVIPIGYEMGKSNPESIYRKSLYNRIFFNSWGERFYKPISIVKRDIF